MGYTSALIGWNAVFRALFLVPFLDGKKASDWEVEVVAVGMRMLRPPGFFIPLFL